MKKILLGLLSFLVASFPAQAINAPVIYNSGCASGIFNLAKNVCLASGGGSVNSVTGSVPIISTGGADPVLSCNVASGVQPGCLASADWTLFNGKQSALSFGALTDAGTDGLTVTGGAGSVIGAGTSLSQHVADTTHNGYLSSVDWNTFNGKGAGTVTSVSLTAPAYLTVGGSPITGSGTFSITGTSEPANQFLAAPNGSAGVLAPRLIVAADIPTLNQNTTGTASNITGVSNATLTTLSSLSLPTSQLSGGSNFTDVGTDGITVTNGTAALVNATGASIAQHVADATHNGYLLQGDWTTFNGKQAAGNYITALTSDVTATGPGSVAATVALVGGSTAANVHLAELAANQVASKTFYVDANYPGAYTATGSVLRPFKTIGAAVTQVIANADNATFPYVVVIASGNYNETITLNNALLYNLSFVTTSYGQAQNPIVSVGPGSGTVITSTSTNTNLQNLLFAGLTLNGDVILTGDITATNFCGGACQFLGDNIQKNNVGFLATNVNNLYFYDSAFNSTGTGPITLNNVAFGLLEQGDGMKSGTALNLVDNPGGNVPAQYSGNYLLMERSTLSSTITIGAGSELDTLDGFMGGATTNNGIWHNYGALVTGAIVLNNGSTYRNRGAIYSGSFTANAGSTVQNQGKYGYTPATSGNWSVVPTEIYGALDSLAAIAPANIVPVTHGGTNLATLTAHDVVVGNGASTVTLVSPSTAGFVLTSNGVGADPSFQTPAVVSPSSISLTQNHILVGNGSNLAADVALSGDATIVSSGALTLSTVNGNVGSFGSSTSIPSFTVNAKGLITAASGNVVIAPAGTLTGTTLASNVVTSSLTSLGVQSASLNMGSNQITAVTDPTTAQMAATKNYVDTQLAQLNPLDAVYAASTANIAGTYTNAVGGVCIGDTFLTTSLAAFTLDGTSPAVGSRVLFKNQTSAFQDGVWTLTVNGNGVTGSTLTRALDSDSSADFNAGQIVPVINGTQAGSSWYQTAVIATCNSDAQTWTKFQNAASAYLLAANNLSDVASASTSFNTISPMTTLGDLIYGGASGAGTRLAGDTSNTRKFLRELSVAGVATAEVWDTLTVGDLPVATVTNGGNTAYTILSTDQFVRSGTTLTSNRAYTLPVCAANIGERHRVKNIATQTFNIILTPNGTDTIDYAATNTILPGGSVPVICAVSGEWDIEQ